MKFFISFLRIWLQRGKWYILGAVLLTIVSVYVFFQNSNIYKYRVELHGCTSYLNFNSLYDFTFPLTSALLNNEKDNAAKFLKVNPKAVENLKSISLDRVTDIVEEADIRYEFVYFIDFKNDTNGLGLIEAKLIQLVKSHAIIHEKYTLKEQVYFDEKVNIDAAIFRLDSIMKSLKDKQSRYYEELYQRKIDLKIKFDEMLRQRKMYYDVILFYGSDKTGQWIKDEMHLDMFILYCILFYFGLSIALTILISADLRKRFFNFLNRTNFVE